MSDWKEREFFTIPNFISLLRIILAFVFLYCYKADIGHKNAVLALIICLSGISDFLDGRIARCFNMVSEWGKLLDPLADKISQLILLLCLINRYPKAAVILCIFIVKEAAVISLGYIAVRMQGENEGAKWYGKLSTAVFYIVMILLILISDINISTARYLLDLCGICITAAFVGYLIHFVRIYMKYRKKE